MKIATLGLTFAAVSTVYAAPLQSTGSGILEAIEQFVHVQRDAIERIEKDQKTQAKTDTRDKSTTDKRDTHRGQESAQSGTHPGQTSTSSTNPNSIISQILNGVKGIVNAAVTPAYALLGIK